MKFVLGSITSGVLTPEEQQRYSRHLLIPEVGEEGQTRLQNASVLLIGTGGLGSPVALYLAAAGVGRLGLVDPDRVDLSNLQRQLLHSDAMIGRSKLDSAAARLREINPHVRIDPHPVRFAPENAISIAQSYDIIIDGSDNFPTRFLSNDTAFFLRKPLIYGAIHRFDGQMSVFAPHLGGPCYRCMLPEIPAPGSVPNCAEAGVLGVLPGIIGSLQAMEAIKLILGIGEIPIGKLLIYDALRSSFRSLKLAHDPACRLCGEAPTIESVDNLQTAAKPFCQIHDSTMQSITAAELKDRLDSGNLNAILLDVREEAEWQVVNIPQARLVPLQTIPSQAPHLPKDLEIIIHCKAGMRSARACEYLMSVGFENVTNVEGGMDAFQKL